MSDRLASSDAGYPQILRVDPRPPAELYVTGKRHLLGARPAVAIVGTRRCTHYGRDVSRELGRDLAISGVHVISGLAAGVDAAAHEGALSVQGAEPIGVVGSGLDVPYPRSSRGLWQAVADRGLLISEAPPGSAPDAWRFPLRNRIIAALAQVVVVVESKEAGGSLHTVEAAIERGIPVMAVPGSIRSSASEGTNRLLGEGCAPVCSVEDILVALSLEWRPPKTSHDENSTSTVLAAVDWTPTSVGSIASRLGQPLPKVLTELYALSQEGFVTACGGDWVRVQGRG